MAKPRLSASQRDLILISAICVISFLLAGRIDLLETWPEFAHRHEEWKIDELLATTSVMALCLLWFSIRRMLELKRQNVSLEGAKVAAQVASKAKGQFLANMSHEIR